MLTVVKRSPVAMEQIIEKGLLRLQGSVDKHSLTGGGRSLRRLDEHMKLKKDSQCLSDYIIKEEDKQKPSKPQFKKKKIARNKTLYLQYFVLYKTSSGGPLL
ncbi:uncharacterized protein LOC144761534 [Lissotriton helveticus]